MWRQGITLRADAGGPFGIKMDAEQLIDRQKWLLGVLSTHLDLMPSDTGATIEPPSNKN